MLLLAVHIGQASIDRTYQSYINETNCSKSIVKNLMLSPLPAPDVDALCS